MLDILNQYVLMLEPIIHLLADVALVLRELVHRALLELPYPLVLALDLSSHALVQLLLPCEALLLLDLQSLLNLRRLLVQGVEDLPLFLDARIPLGVRRRLDPPQVRSDRLQLGLERADAVFSLLAQHVFEVLHPVVAPDALRLHVVSLLLNAGVELIRQVSHHLEVSVLKQFKLIVDLLALVDRVLLVVLDLLVDVLELQLEPPLRVVAQTHHLVEVAVHLAHLLPKPAQLQVVLHRLLVHFYIYTFLI